MWYLIFYQIVFCLSTNREVNKHRNFHCLKTINSDNPRLLGFWANIHLFCYYSRLERNSQVVWGAYSFRFSYCLTFRLQRFGLRRFDSRQRRTHFIVANSHLSVHWIRSVRPLTRTITFVQVLFIPSFLFKKPLRDFPHCASGAIQLQHETTVRVWIRILHIIVRWIDLLYHFKENMKS